MHFSQPNILDSFFVHKISEGKTIEQMEQKAQDNSVL